MDKASRQRDRSKIVLVGLCLGLYQAGGVLQLPAQMGRPVLGGRGHLQGVAIGHDRRSGSGGLLQKAGLGQQGGQGIRVGDQGALDGLPGLLWPSGGPQRGGQEDPDRRLARGGRAGLPQEVDGLFHPTGLQGVHPQAVQGLGMAGVCAQHLAPEVLGLEPSPCPRCGPRRLGPLHCLHLRLRIAKGGGG